MFLPILAIHLLTSCGEQSATNPISPAERSLNPPQSVADKSSGTIHGDAVDKPTTPDLTNPITDHQLESIGCDGSLTLVKGGQPVSDCVASGKGAVFTRVNLKVFQGKDTFGAQYFYMMTTEVTQGFYRQVMGTSIGSSSCNTQGNSAASSPGQPLYCISWLEAAQFANTLSEKLGLETCYLVDRPSKIWPKSLDCKGLRLPTPAEWLWAYEGDGLSSVVGLGDRVWHQGNSNSQTHVVASLKANGAGIYDMAGNVSEWVYGDPDPGPNRQSLSGDQRIYLGGSAGDKPPDIVQGFKENAHFGFQDVGIGFRLVRTAD